MRMRNNSGDASVAGILAGIFVVGILIVIIMFAWPQYNIYAQRAQGQAMLAHAQSAKEVAVAEAKAKMESAELLAQAEVARAKGVAQANTIIGQSLKDNESYLRYLWITDVAASGTQKTVVYIPTEGNMPILEASRLQKEPQQFHLRE